MAGSEAAVELDRVVDRLRSMPLTRLGAHAAGARELAQEFADRDADLAGRERRVVPDVGDAAVGDQVAVTGRDLLALDTGALGDWMSARLREFRLGL